MSSLTKTAVAVIVALGSSAVSAGTMGPVCVPGSVTVPCETRGWDLGIYALYLEPVYDANMGYNSVTITADTTIPRFNVHFNDNISSWDWGFRLEGSYHYGPGMELNVDWNHLRANTGIRELATPSFDGTNLAISFPYGTFRRDSHWDSVDVSLLQHFTAHASHEFALFGGVQFASIKTEDRRFLPSIGAGELTLPSVNNFRTSDFNGFGPRFGGTANWYPSVLSGLSLYGNVAAALLVGSSKFNNFTDITDLVSFTAFGSKTAMVPELDGKLGLAYKCQMGSGVTTLDLGYEWINYFNAQHNMLSALGNESDFAIQGIVFGLNYRGFA